MARFMWCFVPASSAPSRQNRRYREHSRTGPWHVRFDSPAATPKNVTSMTCKIGRLPTICMFKSFSGHATYSTTLQLPAGNV